MQSAPMIPLPQIKMPRDLGESLSLVHVTNFSGGVSLWVGSVCVYAQADCDVTDANSKECSASAFLPCPQSANWLG